jgi:hypothetical protein
MGLQMREKQAVTRETRGEYQKAGKKQKGLILDQFARLTGYNRKYAIRLLAKRQAAAQTAAGGNTLIFKAEKKTRPKNRIGKPVYTRETAACLERLWRFYWYKCGSYLSPIIRDTMDALVSSKAQLLAISGRQIDRLLKPAKDALRLRGFSGAKAAAHALLRKVPLRTHTQTKSA